jgi:LacI family transcriptional regulator
MSTILDVEKYSGVSKSTISRYLNGHTVRPEKKELIEKAIKDLSYTKNPFASGLKNGKTHTIGILIPEITDFFFPPIISNIEKTLRNIGYQTLISNYGEDPKKEKEILNFLVNKHVDGIIIASSSSTGEHIQKCLDKNIPVVLLDRLIGGFDCDAVTSDHYQGTYDALSRVIRKGHSRIAFIRGEESVHSDKTRFHAYEDALKNHNIEVKPKYVVTAGINEYDVSREFMGLLDLPEPPTLIFLSNLFIAIGGLEAIIENDIKIPDDVSILAFDRISSFPWMNFVKSITPEFSSIYQHLDGIGSNVCTLLLDRIESNGKYKKTKQVIVKTSLIMTDSIKSLL